MCDHVNRKGEDGHVNENDPKRPYVRSTRRICGRNVVSAFYIKCREAIAFCEKCTIYENAP
jgi:hypothetical protein